MSSCPRFVNTCFVNGRSGPGSLSNSIPSRRSSISAFENRKYGLYRSKNVPAAMVRVIELPLISATRSIVSRSSTSTKRHGWLLSCDGARPASSMSSRWCSSDTGSGRNGPFVVRRRRMASNSSTAHLSDRLRASTAPR